MPGPLARFRPRKPSRIVAQPAKLGVHRGLDRLLETKAHIGVRLGRSRFQKLVQLNGFLFVVPFHE